MALNHYYTYSKVKSLLRVLAGEIGVNNIQDSTILEIVNTNLFDIAEQLNGATAPDYGLTTTLGDAATNYGLTGATGASLVTATRTVTKAAHGLTSTSIGKRVILWDTSWCGIGTIESVPSTSTFVLTQSFGGSLTLPCSYTVLSAQSSTSLDLSSLKLDKVIKLVDSINGLVAEKKDLAFENLANIDDYDNSVFYNHIGETLYLFKGANIAAWGTLTLHYYRIPNAVTVDADYIDLKEKYMKLLIGSCKLDIYELAQKVAPKELSQSVESKTASIRQTNLEKEATLAGRKA